jgi:metal-responsive CopG/Arc/MetJ family transcriptional regulator
MHVVTIAISGEQLSWVDDVARRSKLNRSRVIRDCIKLAMEVEVAREKGIDVAVPGLAPLHIDEKTYRLLEDIGKVVGMNNMSELLEYIIAGMHVMVRAGVWKLLRPLSELAEEVMRESEVS